MQRFVRTGIKRLALTVALALPLAVYGHGDEEHGDHDSRHGGFVMMYQDIHFEVVMVPDGGVQLYYTDAARAQLPAATVSDVAVEIERAGVTEPVTMAISADGAYWEGMSKPTTSPDDIVRVAFLFQGEPLVIDLPASSFPAVTAQEEGEAAHTEHTEHAGH